MENNLPGKTKLFKFSLLDLFRMTAFMAAAAFLYSMELKWLVPVWLGGVVGYEIGKRTDYWIVWMVMIGMVLGLWIWLGSYLSVAVFNGWRNTWSNNTTVSSPHPMGVVLLFFAIWLFPGLIASWLAWSLRTAQKKKKSR